MKTIHLVILSLCLLPVLAKADAVNENRILRKAGGESKGKVTLRVTRIPYDIMGMPDDPDPTFVSTRTGDVKIPTGEGKARSLVDHESTPGPDFDSTAEGKVKKADVSRNGKVVKYSGNGTAEPVLDSDGDFNGNGKATSKIRGAKVISTSTFKGSRTLRDDMTDLVTEVTNVSASAKGKSKF